MRTIGRRRPRSAPRGDIPWLCDYCGCKFWRSQLRRQPSGYLACPYDVGDKHYARPPHILNNDGTGSSIAVGDTGETVGYPVVL